MFPARTSYTRRIFEYMRVKCSFSSVAALLLIFWWQPVCFQFACAAHRAEHASTPLDCEIHRGLIVSFFAAVISGTTAQHMKATHHVQRRRRQGLPASSIPAVRHLVRAPAPCLRVLWSVFLIAALLLLTLLLYDVLCRFFSYTKVRVYDGTAEPIDDFPALTVCNQSPFSKRGKREVFNLRKLQMEIISALSLHQLLELHFAVAAAAIPVHLVQCNTSLAW